MAYAAYSDSSNSLSPGVSAPRSVRAKKLMVLDVTIPSCEAFHVRQLVATWPDAGVLRCVPNLRDHTVVLEIQLPADRVDDLMHRLICAVPCGEVGCLASRRDHMVKSGMSHGF